MDRRRFLHLTLAGSVAAARAQTSQARALSLVHTHTGESLVETYFDGNRYLADALGRIDGLLRDFRTDEVHPIDVHVLDILHDLQSMAGHEAPFEIISGYRSAQTNAALRRRSTGVAEHSFHMQGRAIDIRLSGYSTSRLHELALAMGRGGVGFYPASDFVHVDSGPVRRW